MDDDKSRPDFSFKRALLMGGLQLLLGVGLVLRASVLTCFGWESLRFGLCPQRWRRQQDDCGDDDLNGVSVVRTRSRAAGLMQEMRQRGFVGSRNGAEQMSAFATTARERQAHKDWQDAFNKATTGQSIFCGHVRCEENFVRGNNDPELILPPPSPMELEAPYYTRVQLLSYWGKPHFADIVMLSLGWAIVSGGIGTLVAYYYQDPNQKLRMEWVDVTTGHIKALISDFKWLPTFMLTGHVTFFVQRWRQYMFAAWGVEGRFKDLGIMIGSDVVDPSSPEARKLMYKIYRFMVLSMALQYKSVLQPLKDMGDRLPIKLRTMGLLTEEEQKVLVPVGSRMRDTVLCWIAREVNVHSTRPGEPGLLYGRSNLQIMEQLAQLRGKMMYFHGNNFYPQPNMWSSMMKMLVDAYCMLLIVGYPFAMLTPLPLTPLTGLQCTTIVSVFLMTLCFWGADSIAYALATPFTSKVDTFNMDALIAGTEQTLFASMRASFDDALRK